MNTLNRFVDPFLDGVMLDFRQADDTFIADELAPWTQTQGDTGTYWINDAYNANRWENPAWSYLTGASRIDSKYTSDSFKVQPYGLEEPVPDAVVRNWLGPVDPKAQSALNLQSKMRIAREVRVEAFFDAATPAVSLAGTARWDSTAANPRANIISANVGIGQRVARGGNTVVFTGAVADNVMGSILTGSAGAAIIDSVKQVMAALGSNLTRNLIAQYLGVDRVLFARAWMADPTKAELSTVNKQGTNEAMLYIWDAKEVYVTVTEQGVRNASYLQTFGPDLYTPDQYRDDKVRADIVRIAQNCVEKVTSPLSLYAIGTVIS